MNPQNKCQDQICQQTRRKSAPWEQICFFELKDQELCASDGARSYASMEALVNSLDTAALSREQLEAEVTKLRSENDQLRMDTDDPFQLLRDLPEDEPRPSPSKFNRGKASASGERRASTARARAPRTATAAPRHARHHEVLHPRRGRALPPVRRQGRRRGRRASGSRRGEGSARSRPTSSRSGRRATPAAARSPN